MITLANLRKNYDASGRQGPPILQDVSLTLNRGEFVCVLGPSGCGKTTLLNLMAGFIAPSAGEITFCNKKISGPSPRRGVVFQESALFPWLNILKNVTFGLEQQGVSKKECLKTAMHYLAQVGMADHAKAFPHTLSGGMKQRVAIARVLALQPELLLMDEPFSALDANTRERLQDELLRLWKAFEKTIFYVTHSVEEAAYLADRVLVMGPAPESIRADIPLTLSRPRVRHSSTMGAVIQHLRDELGTLPCCSSREGFPETESPTSLIFPNPQNT